jgi:hypothetical protein
VFALVYAESYNLIPTGSLITDNIPLEYGLPHVGCAMCRASDWEEATLGDMHHLYIGLVRPTTTPIPMEGTEERAAALGMFSRMLYSCYHSGSQHHVADHETLQRGIAGSRM